MIHPVDRPAPLRAISRPIAIWLPVGVMMWAITVRSSIVDAYFVPDSAAFVYAWSCRNVVAAQRSNTAGNAYSPAFIERVIADASASSGKLVACIPGLDARRNVIMVVMESLSSHHSKFFSGLADWTPNIDAQAREGHAVIDFFANGFSTAQGLVAVLTAHDPLPSSTWDNSRSWRAVNDSLAFRLKRVGWFERRGADGGVARSLPPPAGS